MSTLRANTIQDAAGANSMPVADINQGRAKNWLNMNGIGTIAVRDSYNVSSLIDNGTGDYTEVFTVPMPNINFVPQITSSVNATTNNSFVAGLPNTYIPVVTSARACIHLALTGNIDQTYLMFSVDGD